MSSCHTGTNNLLENLRTTIKSKSRRNSPSLHACHLPPNPYTARRPDHFLYAELIIIDNTYLFDDRASVNGRLVRLSIPLEPICVAPSLAKRCTCLHYSACSSSILDFAEQQFLVVGVLQMANDSVGFAMRVVIRWHGWHEPWTIHVPVDALGFPDTRLSARQKCLLHAALRLRVDFW
jgi:hypothetical protein